MKYFVILSLFLLCVFWVYLAGIKKPESSLEISKLQSIDKIKDSPRGVSLPEEEVESDKSYFEKLEEKVQLEQVSVTPQEVEQLKLNDFHAYLRHEDRVIKQQDKQYADSIMNLEDRKKIAKERLAVKLIEELNSKE
jgi:hypothetical protein